MHAIILCVAAAAVGIDFGWQRMPEGGMVYIIQLDPQTLEALRAGESIESYIPPNVGDVRSYRIVLGTKPLPREAPPATPAISRSFAPKAPDHSEPPPAAPNALPPDPGGKLLAGRPAVFVQEDRTAASGTPKSAGTAEVATEKPAKPWLPLTFTLLGLFASLSANVYLVWIAWDARRRWLAARSTAN